MVWGQSATAWILAGSITRIHYCSLCEDKSMNSERNLITHCFKISGGQWSILILACCKNRLLIRGTEGLSGVFQVEVVTR